MNVPYKVIKPSLKDLTIFTLIWSMIFFIIGIFPFLKNLFSESVQATLSDFVIWSLLISLLFLIISFTYPRLMTGFYKIWIKFGELIGGFISKIILILLFYLIFTPVAFILKLSGKDLLHKKLDRKSNTYWEERESQPGSLKKQF